MITIKPGYRSRIAREAKTALPAMNETCTEQVRALIDKMQDDGGLEENGLLELIRLLRTALVAPAERAVDEGDGPGGNGNYEDKLEGRPENHSPDEPLTRMLRLLAVIRESWERECQQNRGNPMKIGRR